MFFDIEWFECENSILCFQWKSLKIAFLESIVVAAYTFEECNLKIFHALHTTKRWIAKKKQLAIYKRIFFNTRRSGQTYDHCWKKPCLSTLTHNPLFLVPLRNSIFCTKLSKQALVFGRVWRLSSPNRGRGLESH